MKYQEGNFQSYDGLDLYYQLWKPDSDCKAAIIIVHGSFEHSGRYVNLAVWLVDNGYAVYSFDLRGHGRSGGKRAFVSSFNLYARDLEQFILLVNKSEIEKPVFLLGHSVGAIIVLLFEITRESTVIGGMILSAIVLKFINGIPALTKIFSSLTGRFFPEFKLEKLNSKYLSRDPRVISVYDNDPLVYKEGVHAGVLLEFTRSIDKIRSQTDKINKPILILHGSNDRIADIEASRQLYLKARSADKTFKVYENFYHELFNEPGKEEVFTDIINWLNFRLL